MAPKSRRLKSPYPTPRAVPDIKVVLTMFTRKLINSKYLPLLQTGYTEVHTDAQHFFWLKTETDFTRKKTKTKQNKTKKKKTNV